jgi:chorismate-pyruvate lyase
VAFEPLAATYELGNVSCPEVKFITANEMPEPHQTLLAHDNDMTPTLEKFFGETTELEVICKEQNGAQLLRQVVLVTERSRQHIEFGGILISLSEFSGNALDQIRQCHIPLGTILMQNKIPHQGHPSAYFKLIADDRIMKSLNMAQPEEVYGRCNTISSPRGVPLARIVEILPPLAR